MERFNKKEYMKMVRESVKTQFDDFLIETHRNAMNERLDDKISGHWNNAKTIVGNIGRGLTGREKKSTVDVNAYSQAKDKFRKGQKSNKQLEKVKALVNKRFLSNIAPLLTQHNINYNGVAKALNNAIDKNMIAVNNPNMQDHAWNKKQQPQTQETQPQTQPQTQPKTQPQAQAKANV